MRAPGGKKSVWAGLGRDDGSARPAAARAAQLFADFALRGARLIDDANPEHDAVIDTVRGRQCAVLNFPAQNSSFLRRGSYSAVTWAGSRARRWIGPHCNGSWACRAAISGLRSSRRAPLSTMPTHSEHDAVIDTIRERQRAVLNFPVQNSFSRGGSYSAVITRTRGACLPPSRAQPAPAQTARQGFPDRPSGF